MEWNRLYRPIIFIFPGLGRLVNESRGGYLTAFTLTAIILYLVFHQKFERSKFLSFIIGIFLIVVFQAQPLWLVGLLPIVAYQYFANRQFQLIPLFCFGMLFAFLTFQVSFQ